ncbi:dynein regulatory complex protein 1 [Nilaparvata lugens]|uniref:dynein regulatory complex protein 1 n=1 Tax=Nilaparvata lugens TaxID=108931 RepID=UPI00193D9610|nr:dynein regulatory complex protein 1 [Nilaparvata lugens]
MGDPTPPLDQSGLIIDGEPNICSDNAEERQLARRLRIQRRLSATRKRQDEDSDSKERSISGKATQQKTQLESQVESCNNDVFEIIDEGVEAVTNIKIAGNAHEVQKREEDRLAREERIKYLEKEAEIADEKYQEINKKWEEIAKFNDPLDLFEETERQKDKCRQLLDKKDVVIKRLQEELKMAELRFIKDQEKQSADMNLLVFRINEQIKIMRKVVKNQIALIEDGIETERLEAIQTFNKKWEGLNRQREKEQVNNLNSKLNSLEEHNQEMKRIMLVHQEKFRDSKINLEENIQLLQREVESVKAVCLLNREKVDYNYQVLKKRDDLNILQAIPINISII